MGIEDEFDKILAVEVILDFLQAPPDIAEEFRKCLDTTKKEDKFLRAIIAGHLKTAAGQKGSLGRKLRFSVARLHSQHLASQKALQTLFVLMLRRLQDLDGRLEALEKG